MVANTTLILANFSSIGSTVIGSDSTIGLYLVGAIILITIIIALFSARLGMFGAVVILPATAIVLATYGYLPSYAIGFVWLAVGTIIGLAMLSLFQENK